MRTVLKWVLILLVVIVLGLAAGLAWAHIAIRRERMPLPPPASLFAPAAGGPLRVSVVNTASQAMPRSAVLDVARDPHTNSPYVMSHPSFVLQWADGKILLVDTGMSRAAAADFGRPIEMMSGGAAIVPLGSTAERLGPSAKQVQGVIFTHLHTDHVEGIGELCGAAQHPIDVFMTEAQAERPNYTTRPGVRLIDQATCARRARLNGASPFAVPGFPGVVVIAAGGHTPGSQIIVVTVGEGAQQRRYAFAGDTINNIDGVLHDIPKPTLYRLLIVPEDETRQAELRRYLRQLHETHATTVVSAHDQLAIERSGIAAWAPPQ
jgi:glyoxylase-like metal-dependent hydrolase (beta-lactamase superfamily II)